MNTQPLTCEMFDAMIPDYLDDSLNPDARAALESHASACLRCGALFADLTALTRDASTLPDLTPSRDLWPDIAARLETPVVKLPARGAAAAQHRARSHFLSPGWLAAAAAVLVAATASLTVMATRAWGPSAPSAPAATVASNGGPAAPAAPAPRVLNASAPRPAVIPVQRVYDREIAQLDSIVHDRRSHLDSATVAVIEKNLRIIDTAIAQSRTALAHDPNNRFLHDQLNDALDQKVSLLRTAALLPART